MGLKKIPICKEEPRRLPWFRVVLFLWGKRDFGVDFGGKKQQTNSGRGKKCTGGYFGASSEDGEGVVGTGRSWGERGFLGEDGEGLLGFNRDFLLGSG